MKVKQLKDILANLPDDMDVVLHGPLLHDGNAMRVSPVWSATPTKTCTAPPGDRCQYFGNVPAGSFVAPDVLLIS